MSHAIRFASALSTARDGRDAVDEVVARIERDLGDRPIHLVQVFLSPEFAADAEHLSGLLRAMLKPAAVIGCTAGGVIGDEAEAENGPALAVLAAHLPDVAVTPFALSGRSMDDWMSLLDNGAYVRSALGFDAAKLIVLLVDPFTTPVDELLSRLDAVYAGVPIVGGLASAAREPGGNRLLLDDRVSPYGVVGVALDGPIEVNVVVSQGCRPIGRAMTVSEADENVILALNDDQALAEIQTVVGELDDADREMLQNGLLIGRAIDSDKDDLSRGDFLIRSVLGANQDNGAVVVGDTIHPGERVQLHVRDAATAREDLEMMLTPQSLYDPASGALLFSCNGRGSRLFSEPNTDLNTVRGVLGDVPVAGFFCAGEIGPISGRTFLHGHTASVAIIRAAPAPA